MAHIDELFARSSYMFGEWNKAINSCITHCADILRVDGLDEFLPGAPGTSLLRSHVPPGLYGK